MLTTAGREATIDRITEHLGRFDDDTLVELARLTDPATYVDAGRAGTTGSTRAHGLTRRELVAGLLTGGVVVSVAAGGAVLALRPDSASAGETRRLVALLGAHERLEAIGLDGAARAGLTEVGAALASTVSAAGELLTGVDMVEGILSVPVPGVDTGFYALLRQNVLEPARATTTRVQELDQTCRLELTTPLEARIASRDALRREIATLKAANAGTA
jgi:hypothetical protein